MPPRIKEKEKLTRYGYEVFPWLMFLILMVVTLENVLANTFYKEAPAARRPRPQQPERPAALSCWIWLAP